MMRMAGVGNRGHGEQGTWGAGNVGSMRARSVAAVGGKDELYPYRCNYASSLIETHIIIDDMR
jgi:hypothetical protein